jgi:VanZ family protein
LRWAWRALLGAILILILFLSLLPKPPPVLQRLDLSDKIEHFAAYAILGACAMLSVRRVSPLVLVLTVACCSFYGGIIEIIQPAVGRSMELGDFVVDIGGSALGAGVTILARLYIIRRRSRKEAL